MQVKDASCYLVHLMEHRAVDRTVDSHWGFDVKKLMLSVNQYYCNKKNVRICGQLLNYCSSSQSS